MPRGGGCSAGPSAAGPTHRRSLTRRPRCSRGVAVAVHPGRACRMKFSRSCQRSAQAHRRGRARRRQPPAGFGTRRSSAAHGAGATVQRTSVGATSASRREVFSGSTRHERALETRACVRTPRHRPRARRRQGRRRRRSAGVIRPAPITRRPPCRSASVVRARPARSGDHRIVGRGEEHRLAGSSRGIVTPSGRTMQHKRDALRPLCTQFTLAIMSSPKLAARSAPDVRHGCNPAHSLLIPQALAHVPGLTPGRSGIVARCRFTRGTRPAVDRLLRAGRGLGCSTGGARGRRNRMTPTVAPHSRGDDAVERARTTTDGRRSAARGPRRRRARLRQRS